jgi:glycosyltransferase involved in cell wall biosynthesis
MKVSVIIPCFNVEKYIENGIQSIINQTYKNLEIICLDDGSTDNSLNILNNLSKSDSRIRIYQNYNNLGLVATLNKLVSLSTCEILVRMDPDDISLPHRIEKLIEVYNANLCDIVSSDYSFIDSNGNFINQKKLSLLRTKNGLIYTTFFNSPIPHPQTLIKKNILLKYPYDENFTSAEDYNLWANILLNENFKINIIDEILYHYRINPEGISNLSSETQIENHVKIAKFFLKGTFNINIDNMNFWLIAKKKYDFVNTDKQQLLSSISDVSMIYKRFVKHKNLEKEEIREVKNYTAQYLIYLYFTVFKECSKVKKKQLALIVIFRSILMNFKLIFQFSIIKWILKQR